MIRVYLDEAELLYKQLPQEIILYISDNNPVTYNILMKYSEDTLLIYFCTSTIFKTLNAEYFTPW